MKNMNIKYRLIALYRLFLSFFTTKNPYKLCGKNENCFKHGKCWGHLEGILCEFLGELQNPISGLSLGSCCMKTWEKVNHYETKDQYDRAKKIFTFLRKKFLTTYTNYGNLFL